MDQKARISRLPRRNVLPHYGLVYRRHKRGQEPTYHVAVDTFEDIDEGISHLRKLCQARYKGKTLKSSGSVNKTRAEVTTDTREVIVFQIVPLPCPLPIDLPKMWGSLGQ